MPNEKRSRKIIIAEDTWHLLSLSPFHPLFLFCTYLYSVLHLFSIVPKSRRDLIRFVGFNVINIFYQGRHKSCVTIPLDVRVKNCSRFKIWDNFQLINRLIYRFIDFRRIKTIEIEIQESVFISNELILFISLNKFRLNILFLIIHLFKLLSINKNFEQ